MTVTRQEQWRQVVAQGWVAMLLIMVGTVITQLMLLGMAGDFSPLAKDPGEAGIYDFAFLFTISALMPVLIRSFDARAFRWFVFGFTILYAFIFFAHQLGHVRAGERMDVQLFFDVAHHIVGIWASIYAFRWARAKVPKDAEATETVASEATFVEADGVAAD